MGFEEGELAPIRQVFQGNIATHDCDAWSFLRKTTFVHDQIP
jgi:hypothetical protein